MAFKSTKTKNFWEKIPRQAHSDRVNQARRARAGLSTYKAAGNERTFRKSGGSAAQGALQMQSGRAHKPSSADKEAAAAAASKSASRRPSKAPGHYEKKAVAAGMVKYTLNGKTFYRKRPSR